MEDLEGKVALVTGASRGVGAATAVALAEAGCHVACAARATTAAPQRTPGTLDETVARVEHVGRRGLSVPTNLAVDEEVEAMVATTLDHFGRLDVLVNNAAITFIGDLGIPLHRYDLVMQVNLRAPMIAIRQAAPALSADGGGVVINVSSVAALFPHSSLMAYGMSKIGLERLTVDAAAQLAPSNVAVNCFRIDMAVASEGFVANTPGVDHSNWEPSEVAAEGIVWMVRQPLEYSGRRESMYGLRHREGIMAPRIAAPPTVAPPVELLNGLVKVADAGFEEPYPDGGG
ncbi:MAG TPA: SDR family NAD(P)-dependent oxidoreductase [Acidimicrobiales bacterium]|jgi:NAD(P)-dependent dehydrogenase (short-subunit alcohol dehydrogenase family)|nr:SDR family NAD(P)-dependent oxidoreductase [Acidimicrobiales bacterium]